MSKDCPLYMSKYMAKIMKSYCEWIYTKLKDKDIKDVYFLSREGAFFNVIFERFLLEKDWNDINNVHLEISRRSLCVPNIKTKNDIKELVFGKPTRFYFLSELLLCRFGLKIDLDNDINLKYLSKQECFELVLMYYDEILSNSSCEMQHLLQYFENIGISKKKDSCH